MELTFLNNYTELNDKEIVDKIINKPYNEEAAAYLIYNRYDPLLQNYTETSLIKTHRGMRIALAIYLDS